MKNTLHINLWAGPCTGKSGVSGQLFGKMKENSIDCELVREAAKEYAWNGNLHNMEQIIITTKQYELEAKLHGKVDFIIVDTSVLMGMIYCNENYKHHLLGIMKYLTQEWNIVHYFLERDLTKTYETNGRMQNLEQSIEKDNEIKNFLKEHNISFKQIPVKDAAEIIFNNIKK